MSMNEESKENLKIFIAEIIKESFQEVVREIVIHELFKKDVYEMSARIGGNYETFKNSSDLYR